DPALPRGGPGRDVYGNFFLKSLQADGVVFRDAVADDGSVRVAKSGEQLWTVDASRDDKRLPRQLVLLAREPFDVSANQPLRITLRHESEFGGQGIGRFRLSYTTTSDPTIIVSVSAKLRPVLETASRSAEDAKRLADFYRGRAGSLKTERDELKQSRKEMDDLGIASTLILRERPSTAPLSTELRIRGQFLSKGETVYAAVPASLHPLPPNEPANRLGLARWLVSRDNPMTARVAVNRIWETYFGRGIVETSEDFGTQGERPTHPELLDWLAVEFMDRGWRMKAIHRLIVTSATYRQESNASPQALEKDPYNRLLARGPRFRMEAEMVRDAVLSAAGLLSLKIGGPSVFPPQPDGIWDLPYNDDKWTDSQGEDRYRRGLYTFIRRTAPYPSLLTFDGTSREFCTVRRIRTNTPLQALTTLNDPAFFEAAQALARRIRSQGGNDRSQQAVYAFRLCTGRVPQTTEVSRIVASFDRERAYFQQHGDQAKRVSHDGDATLAAWTMVSNALLNLDETITKE
ncbi:MAG: DUF1553 domain-containing protein, partial [Acidobacteriaceae bacterium]|nr:DUF1553 domain-containing protein [Acidobacteriaceae bacterium]